MAEVRAHIVPPIEIIMDDGVVIGAKMDVATLLEWNLRQLIKAEPDFKPGNYDVRMKVYSCTKNSPRVRFTACAVLFV